MIDGRIAGGGSVVLIRLLAAVQIGANDERTHNNSGTMPSTMRTQNFENPQRYEFQSRRIALEQYQYHTALKKQMSVHSRHHSIKPDRDKTTMTLFARITVLLALVSMSAAFMMQPSGRPVRLTLSPLSASTSICSAV